MINVTVTGLQKAQDALKKELERMMSDKTVLVGIHEDAGMTDDGELTMAQLGAIQHFGTQTIPARPWLDVGVKTGAPDYLEVLENHSDDLDTALEIIGQIAVGKVQVYITELQDPPNAPSTIAQKGSSNPLIDTGAMRQSVTYSIMQGKPEEGLG